MGDSGEDDENGVESSKRQGSYGKPDPLPTHLSSRERPRYENDIDVSLIRIRDTP